MTAWLSCKDKQDKLDMQRFIRREYKNRLKLLTPDEKSGYYEALKSNKLWLKFAEVVLPV